MADEPFFPSPDAARRSPAPAAAPVPAPAPVPARSPEPARVVRALERPAAPSLEAEEPAKKSALSPAEIKSLLAVNTELQRGGKGREVLKRGRRIVIPTGLVSTVIHVVIGDYALPIIFVLCLASILWIARPLLRRDEWS